MQDGAVAGLVASDADGYIKINCKAVVCACGGMGGNPEMMAYFMPDMAQALTGEDESLTSMSANDGRGVQMAYWAGAHLETTPVAGMNMKGLSVPGKMNCLPQAVWIDENGRRFCQRVLPHFRAARVPDRVHEPQDEVRRGATTTSPSTASTPCPSTPASPPMRRTSPPCATRSTRPTRSSRAPTRNRSRTEGQGGPGGGGPMTQVEWIADDTLEGLAEPAGTHRRRRHGVRRPDRAMERLLRGRRRRGVRPRRRGALPGEGRPLLRLHLRPGARRDHGHHGRHHHRRRA